MVLDKLGSSLRSALDKVKGAMFVDEKVIDTVVREIQRALLQSDVNVKLVLELSKKIKQRILKEQLPGLDKREALVKVIYEELVIFLGEERTELTFEEKPTIIMMLGLFGNGKTTTSGKLAKYHAKRSKKVLLVGLDVWRPAAMDQLEQMAQRAKVDVIIDKEEKDPLKIWQKAKLVKNKYDLIIVDTAGRDALNDELITEIEAITTAVNPHEKLLVMAADMGQAAQAQAEQFEKSCGVTGVVVTKMEGTAKGGGALSACAITNAPIKFIGVGEKIDDLEIFNPKGFVSRLLGMGDIEALLEKAQLAMNEEESKDLSKKLMKGQFSLRDLYDQMNAMKSMGSLGKIMEMIPGMSQLKIPKEALKGQEERLEKWKYIMDSCTNQELEFPDETMNNKRIERIAKGSGTTESNVRELLKHYKQSKKMVKMMGGSEKKMEKMMQNMQKGGGMPGMKGMKF